jgi:hypothetical protein
MTMLFTLKVEQRRADDAPEDGKLPLCPANQIIIDDST